MSTILRLYSVVHARGVGVAFSVALHRQVGIATRALFGAFVGGVNAHHRRVEAQVQVGALASRLAAVTTCIRILMFDWIDGVEAN